MNFYKCRCGLTIEQVSFIDDVCIVCYENDSSKIGKCKICGVTDEPEYFINHLCRGCFIKEQSE